MSKDNMTEQEMWFQGVDTCSITLESWRLGGSRQYPVETIYQMFKQRMQEEDAENKAARKDGVRDEK